VIRRVSALLAFMRGFSRDESGVSSAIVVLLLTATIGFMGFGLDFARAYQIQRALQTSSDAAALAGAWMIPNSTAVSTAENYGAESGKLNAIPASADVTVSMVSGYPSLSCLTDKTSTLGACVGTEISGGANTITVKQQAVVPTYFAKIFNVPTVTVTAQSEASARGGNGQQLNLMIILDTTHSMGDSDSGCSISGATREQCALAGVKALLSGLTPSLDYVGLMTFPGFLSSSDAADINDCSTSETSSMVQTYSNSPTYTLATLNQNFQGSDASTLDGVNGCASGGVTDNPPGSQGTYYAQAIIAAQAALAAQSSINPHAQNVIVFASDGGANSSTVETDITGTICDTSPCVVAAGKTKASPAGTTLTVSTCPSGCGASTSAQQEGPLAVGQTITNASGTVLGTIVKQLKGTTGGVGTYQLSTSQQLDTANTAMIATNSVTINGTAFQQNIDQCQQAIAAAQQAIAAGTWIFSIAYGSSTATGGSSTCTTDTTSALSGDAGISSCTTMQDMASTPLANYFFSTGASGNSGGTTCPNANSITDLIAIFKTISTALSAPRLIPVGTT
jgi:hypothetical protein